MKTNKEVDGITKEVKVLRDGITDILEAIEVNKPSHIIADIITVNLKAILKQADAINGGPSEEDKKRLWNIMHMHPTHEGTGKCDLCWAVLELQSLGYES